MKMGLRRVECLVWLFASAASIAPVTASAQVVFGATGSNGALCIGAGGQVEAAPGGDDCDEDFIKLPAYQMSIGPDETQIFFDASDGSATFGGTTAFNGPVSFASGTTFGGEVSAAGLTSTNGMTNTGNFTNTGNVTVTGSLGTGSITSSGSGTFTGALSSSQLTTGGINATSLFSTGNVTVQGFFNAQNGASILGTTQLATVQVFQSLSVQSGATVDMNGNRIQDVGAPVAGTDAVNKNYVDALAGSASEDAAAAQATADEALANAAGAQATADTGLARTAGLGASVAEVLGGGAAYNEATGALSAPSYTVAGENYDSVGAAFDAVDQQLSLIDDRVAALSDSTGRGFRQANGGIAAAMALGGTMIVPDSTVSMSFNLATYRGQQGFAGVVAVRAAPKVYVSGGVTGSTVKGSTGGRVGVALGF